MILVLVVIEFIIGGSMSKHNNEKNNSTNKIFKTLQEQKKNIFLELISENYMHYLTSIDKYVI